jgi:hypothetical protein
MKNRKSFLTGMLWKCLSEAKEDPKVRKLLTPKEAEKGLEIVIKRIVQEALEREATLGRKLAFQEFYELMLKTLNEFSPRVSYIV